MKLHTFVCFIMLSATGYAEHGRFETVQPMRLRQDCSFPPATRISEAPQFGRADARFLIVQNRYASFGNPSVDGATVDLQTGELLHVDGRTLTGGSSTDLPMVYSTSQETYGRVFARRVDGKQTRVYRPGMGTEAMQATPDRERIVLQPFIRRDEETKFVVLHKLKSEPERKFGKGLALAWTISPDSRKVAVVASDIKKDHSVGTSRLQVWDLQTGRMESEVPLHGYFSSATVRFSADGNEVGAFAWDGTVGNAYQYRLGNLEARTVQKDFQLRPETRGLNYAADLKHLYTHSSDAKSSWLDSDPVWVTRYDLEHPDRTQHVVSGPIGSVQIPAGSESPRQSSFAFTRASSDGDLTAATMSGNGILLTRTGEKNGIHISVPLVASFEFLNDGSGLVITTQKGELFVQRFPSKACLQTLGRDAAAETSLWSGPTVETLRPLLRDPLQVARNRAFEALVSLVGWKRADQIRNEEQQLQPPQSQPQATGIVRSIPVENEGVTFISGATTYWAPAPGATATKYWNGSGWTPILAQTTQPSTGVVFQSGGITYWAPAPGARAQYYLSVENTWVSL